MRILGLLFILGGVWLCWTVLFWWVGLVTIGVGALLCIAGRGSAPGRLARAVQWTLGAAIGGSVVLPAVVFLVYALGFGPGQSPSSSRAKTSPAGLHSTQPAQSAKRHPITH